MGSIKRSGRNHGPEGRRRKASKQLRPGLLNIESLEGRILMATGVWQPTSTSLTDVRNGPMANEGQDLIDVYQASLSGSSTTELATQFPTLQFQGNSVNIHVNITGNLNTALSSMTSLGFQTLDSSAYYGAADGYAPIGSLPQLAGLSQLRDASPNYKKIAYFVGEADNEADTAMQAATARQVNNVDGTGVTVGVLSDSVNESGGGLAGSFATGDLPNPNTINVIQDDPNGPGTDEGRAMLENIHDIAPGASLAFATGDVTDLQFGQNIEALAKAGAKVIADDLGTPNDPFFQDGYISQAIDQVTSQGVSYFSAAGNESDQGYLSNWRSTTTTGPVGSLPAGTYMNFNPSGGTTTELPITVSNENGFAVSKANPAELIMNFDQPDAQEEVAGAPGPTSEVDFYVLDATGAIVAQSNNNNVAIGAPEQDVAITTPGSYFVVMNLVSGPAPSQVEFINFSETANAIVSQQFGTGPAVGGTYYPSSVGHNAGTDTIGVGAVPWWAAPPYLNQNPLNNEPFSSTGPSLTVFSPTGTALPTSTLNLNPAVSGTDGGNTSFFGQVVDTTQPLFPGEPATATNLSQPNLPSFFGTSSATPNVGAVAALMLQKSPTLTPAQIRSALIASAQPLNGTAAGTWGADGGYGLVNAVKAVSSVGNITIISTTPAAGATVSPAPSVIDVTFDRPVVLSSITAADLVFTSLPAGVASVTVGAPIGIDSPTDPTQVAFPITYNLKPDVGTTLNTANGTFGFTVQGPINSEDGKTNTVTPYNATFTINDTTMPTVTGVTINGRVVSISFSKPLAPTLNNNTVFVALTDSMGNIITNLDDDPKFKITWSAKTNTVNLDYSGLSQSEMPSGYYKIVVKSGAQGGVTDTAGNPLNGTFYGVFPSGFRGTITPTTDLNFDDFLGFLSVSAPVITSLKLTAASDSGIQGDANTNINDPIFIGQVTDSFPGSVAGDTIQGQFSALHGGALTLVPQNGRGSTGGSPDFTVTTNANGSFNIPASIAPIFLPEGFQYVQLVAIGQPDQPPLPGLSSLFDSAFRIDETPPSIVSATVGAVTPDLTNSLPLGATFTNVSSLSTLSLDVVDPASPSNGPLATPPSVTFPALNPATAGNVSNYTLKNLTTGIDESKYITSATFVETGSDFVSAPSRASSASPDEGRIDLTIAPGLPAGDYQLIAHTTTPFFGGLTDAAGNPLTEAGVAGEGTPNFYISFSIQSQPVYITSVSTNVANAQGNTLLPYSYYEINPRAGDIVSNPPTSYYVDFSAPLNPTTINANTIQLIRTANSPTSPPDGDFGTFGEGGLGSTGTGFTRVDPAGTTVTLTTGPNGPNTRVVLQLPGGFVLPADHYRFYIPNNSPTLVVRDIFGNQLDGEFLGDPSAEGGTDLSGNPTYEDLLPNGQERAGMSGDGVAAGAFTAAFVVVPTGNLVYAQPGYVENPLLPSTEPDGSISKPYPVLAPQAVADAANSSTINDGNPNDGLNATINFTNFNSEYDRAALGKFARSAFYAATQLAMNGPVVIVALPGITQVNPTTGQSSQPTFVLQAPAGSDPTINNGSGSVPYDTMLVFNQGSTLKLENASLFVQNQGSALQSIGGTNPSQAVTFTSAKDNSVGANPFGPGGASNPQGGDWGGIVYRNFDAAIPGRTDTFPVDGTLIGPNNTAAVSGADDALSEMVFTNVRYGGGAVPATNGQRYDEIMLFNSRPMIAQDSITLGVTSGSTATSGVQAGISADLDSFREDDTRRGPLFRQDNLADNSLNGIYVRANASGVAQVTNAETYPSNPVIDGGAQNYTFDAPIPYIFTSLLDVGLETLVDTPQQTANVTDRLYIQPGMLLKFQRGAGIQVLTPGSSLNVGQRTYIAGFDSDASVNGFSGLVSSTYGPNLPNGSPNLNFQANALGAAQVVFTSLYDNTATTSFTDPITGLVTTIVPMVDSGNTDPTSKYGSPGPIDPFQPSPGNANVPAQARWGSISITSGAIALIDQADIRYSGGSLNLPGGTVTRNALTIYGSSAFAQATPNPDGIGFTNTVIPGLGGRVMITNDTFDSNADTPIYADPDALLATDPLTPLSSGHPFFHGNILTNNTYNALAVGGGSVGNVGPPGNDGSNLSNDTIWDQTDITYLVRGSIVPNLPTFFNFPGIGTGGGGVGNVPIVPALGPIPTPSVLLTIQSALPGTMLANGSTIPSPGSSVYVKMMGAGNGDPVNGTGTDGNDPLGISGSSSGGAGFLFGVDNGIDPPLDPTIDQGNNTQLRILGIGGNETTGQPRVPVIITSVHDSTVGPTVNGVPQNQVIPGDSLAPAAGDGGVIDFGANSLTTYNALDINEGNKINNADIRYMTRIEMQGGGNITSLPLTATGNIGGIDDLKAGVLPPQANGSPNPNDGYIQANAPKELTIADSNFSDFSQDGILAHPGYDLILDGPNAIGGGLGGQGVRDSGVASEPDQLLLLNDTFADMPVGVRMVGENISTLGAADPYELLLLNNTFYNDALGLDIIATGGGATEQVHVAAMDNIFSNSSTAAIQSAGLTGGSVLEYNLFNQNAAQVTGPLAGANFQPINGNPDFVSAVPNDPSADDFNLQPDSAAIDSARSELNLNDTSTGAFIGTLIPLDTETGNVFIRNTNNRLPLPDGRLSNNGNISNELALPGYGDTQPSARGYVDEWEAVLPGTVGAVAGPVSNASTFDYAPLVGQRDILGNLRQKDPNSPNVGFGSEPFFDIGAYEYRIFNPPHITGVTAVVTDATSATGTSIVNLYGVGTPAGTNKPVQSIQVTFDDPIDATTLTNLSVMLEASGGTGSFINPIIYNLSGKLTLDPTERILTINLGAAGLVLNNDEYRLIIHGSGPNVVKDTSGLALDGQNVANDNPVNPQLALPSGSGAPGTNFFDTFVINTAAPAVVPDTLVLAPSSVTSTVLNDVTNKNLPGFAGQVSVPLPNIESVAGLTVILDISTLGNGVFDRIDAGTAVTNALGQFVVTVGQDAANTGLVTNTSPLPDSFYNVGADGQLGTADDYGYTWARVRVIDQSGNASDQPTDPPAQFAANNALNGAVVDTAPPTISSFSPAPDTLIQPSNGSVTFTFTTNKNLNPASLNANSILVTSNGTNFPINPIGPANITYLGNQTKPGGSRLGPEQISFTVSGNLPNGFYTVTLKGSGANPITDIAGNPLAGNGTTAGSDFTSQNPIITPGLNLLYVNASATPTVAAPADGTFENPYPTIMDAMAVATPGTTIGVLPGVYTENVVMDAFVKLVSADPSSTDSVLVAGNPLQTVIRAPEPLATAPTTGPNVTVLAANLPYVAGVDTEVSGFSIASPLEGTAFLQNPAVGPIDPNTIAVGIQNANLLLENDYITDSEIGVDIVVPSVPGVLMPRIINDVIAGNVNGIEIDDNGSNTIPVTAKIFNDDLVYNTIGLFANNLNTSKTLATVANDIFWENHDQTTARNGFGIEANVSGSLLVGNSLFQGNGASDTSPIYAGVNVGNGFNAATLSATPSPTGNFTGNPSFIFPVDPRPNADGPATFYISANFDLQSNSAAIDAANPTFAPPTDILGRTPVRTPGKGFPGTGPASVGAFDFGATGGQTLTGAFQISSVALTNSASTITLSNSTAVFSAQTGPKAITVTFDKNVNRATVTPSDLVLYGDGLATVNGAHATAVTWINATTAKFTLTGNYSTQGTVMVKVNTGAITSTSNVAIKGYLGSFVIKPAVSVSTAATTTVKAAIAVAPTPPTAAATPVSKPATTAAVTPPPAATPMTVSKTPAGPLSTPAAKKAAAVAAAKKAATAAAAKKAAAVAAAAAKKKK